jgi:hypothetical protein
MKRFLPFLLVLLVADLAVGTGTNDQQAAPPVQSYKTSIDYTVKTSNLWGIASVTLHDDGSVTLVDATTNGFGYGLMLSDSGLIQRDRVTLKEGESCSLSDGDHAFLTYTYQGLIAQKQIMFCVTDRFDARSFGDGVKELTKSVFVRQYGDGNATPSTATSPDFGRDRGGAVE